MKAVPPLPPMPLDLICTPAKWKNARSPTARQLLPARHPTHLSSKVLPTNSVLGTAGVILVPPVQVQLCGAVAGWETLDMHAWGQAQLHCGKWRGKLRVRQTTHAQAQTGAGGYSKGRLERGRLWVRNLASCPENVPIPPKQFQWQLHLLGSPCKMMAGTQILNQWVAVHLHIHAPHTWLQRQNL